MAMFGALTARLRAAVNALLAPPESGPYGLLHGLNPAIGTPPLAGTRERLSAFANTPWLHAVADKVASAFAATEWKVYVLRRGGQARRAPDLERATGERRVKLLAQYRQAGELVELEDHILRKTLDMANPFHSGHAMRKLMALYFDLAGDVFLVKERNAFGTPNALWPIPPNWVTATPTPSHPRFRVGFSGWHGEIPASEILWISNPNPENPYGRGVGMVQALADEIETDEYSAKYARQFFLNSARPDFLVFPKDGGQLGEPAVRRLEEEWRAQHQGVCRGFKPHFMTREVGVHEFEGGSKFRDLQFTELRAFERDAIRQTWGLPGEILGILAPGSNRATITQASHIFARWVLLPRLEFFRSAFQELLVPEYDEKLVLDFVSPVEADPELVLEYAKAAPWARTVDEWRALQGLGPLLHGQGAAFLVPVQLQPMNDFGGGMSEEVAAGMDLANLKTDELRVLRRLALWAEPRS